MYYLYITSVLSIPHATIKSNNETVITGNSFCIRTWIKQFTNHSKRRFKIPHPAFFRFTRAVLSIWIAINRVKLNAYLNSDVCTNIIIISKCFTVHKQGPFYLGLYARKKETEYDYVPKENNSYSWATYLCRSEKAAKTEGDVTDNARPSIWLYYPTQRKRRGVAYK